MWLDEIEERLHDGMLRNSENEERMARVLREFTEIVGGIYHHYENIGDAPIRHFVGAIEDMSDDAKALIETE